MNPIELMCMVWAEGLCLERRGTDIVCVGKSREEVHPALLTLIQEHKQTLLSVMTDCSHSSSARR
jgi:putative N-acetylmannosamine-6-phosphate epimerase